MSPAHLSSKILIVGGGFSGLATARVLCDDGFTDVHLVGEDIGGTWNRTPGKGGIYPGLLTNSAYGGFELSGLEMPKDDLDATSGRIKAETIADYLLLYFERFVKDRVNVSADHLVVQLSRPPSGVGWVARIKDCRSGEEHDESFEKVVLAQGPLSNPHTPEALRSPAVPFKGPMVHSARLNGDAYEQVLDAAGPVVIVGGGKSAIDIAANLAGQGKDVTIVSRKMRMFAPLNESLTVDPVDRAANTRLLSTLVPDQHVTTRIECFLHKTRLGSMIVRKILDMLEKGGQKAFGIEQSSPLMLGQPNILWRGPDHFGGRAAVDAKSFHGLYRAGKVKVLVGVEPVAVMDDGAGLRLSDGQDMPAAAVVLATGFDSSSGFIPLAERLQLGLEPVPPTDPSPKSPLADIPLLAHPPAPPTIQPATHVYKGIVPAGALQSRDLVCNGFFMLLRQPYTVEIAAHWISSYFSDDPHLRVPETNAEAFEIAEAHATFVRHRYPLSTIPWATHAHFPIVNAPHFNDGLIADMGLPLRRAKPGLVAYYVGELKSAGLATLGAERRALRQGKATTTAPSMLDQVLGWLGLGRLAATYSTTANGVGPGDKKMA